MSDTTLRNQDFLLKLLEAAAPSGCERRAADIWKKEAEKFAEVSEDSMGNVYASIGPKDAPAIALMGHIDEIGLIVSDIDEKGYIYFLSVGGWDPQVLVGQRIRLLAEGGDIVGVIGKKAIHVMSVEERQKVSRIEDLWIDVGLEAEEVKKRIKVGTYGVIDVKPLISGNTIMSKALDNRAGAFIVLEALREVAQSGKLSHRVIAVGTSQEEIGLFGAATSSFSLKPVAGIAIDVTHESNQPGVDAKKYGRSAFGSGAAIGVGPLSNPVVVKQLIDIATKNELSFTLSANGRYSFTDNDALALSNGGVPSAIISIPNRYMHSPNEMVDIRDLETIIKLTVAWVKEFNAKDLYVRQ